MKVIKNGVLKEISFDDIEKIEPMETDRGWAIAIYCPDLWFDYETDRNKQLFYKTRDAAQNYIDDFSEGLIAYLSAEEHKNDGQK